MPWKINWVLKTYKSHDGCVELQSSTGYKIKQSTKSGGGAESQRKEIEVVWSYGHVIRIGERYVGRERGRWEWKYKGGGGG